ncbi:energy transducer TonB [Bacteroidales bacterium OttesenSCG-928-M06]|nr:energy transducer TonB [Bacteroidales bacterium OttesenSCG-928-M06]
MNEMVKKTILFHSIFILIFSCGIAYSQSESTTNKADSTLLCNHCDSIYNRICPPHIFGHPEELPMFPGGEREMMKFIAENLKYPPECKDDSIQGRVVIRFIVNKSGEIVCPYVCKSLHPDADKEALRIIELIPTWKPASNDGIPCEVCYTLPILFKLE